MDFSVNTTPTQFGQRGDVGLKARRLLQESPRRAHALLRSGIRTGLFSRRELLVEDALVRSMATSRNSVRLALQMLAREGLVQRRTNRGTDVLRGLVPILMSELLPLLSDIDEPVDVPGMDGRMSLKQLDYGIVPMTELLGRRLESDDDSVFMRELIVLLHGEPVAVHVGYYPLQHAPLELKDAVIQFKSGTSRLAHMLKHLYGLTPGAVEIDVEAVACDERTARMLKIEPGAPMLMRETVIRDETGQPCLLDYSHWRGDRVSFKATFDLHSQDIPQ